ncbi:Leucine-rich repeat serine/threonine-protein kinase 2, partial [Phytophthora boehmeriae]
FGLSFSESGSCSLMKKKGDLGAMAWRAPEFAIADDRPTHKSDVYSLAMCIVQAVTCAYPWGKRRNKDIRECLQEGKIMVERPTEMTDDQWNLVERMKAVSPNDRPEMNGVLLELEKFADAERAAEEAAKKADEKGAERDAEKYQKYQKECPYQPPSGAI